MKLFPQLYIIYCQQCPLCRHNESTGYNCVSEDLEPDFEGFIVSDKALLSTPEWPEIPTWCPLPDHKPKEAFPEKPLPKNSKKTRKLCDFADRDIDGTISCERRSFMPKCSENPKCQFKGNPRKDGL